MQCLIHQLLFSVLLLLSVHGGEIDFCGYDYGGIQKGSINLDNAHNYVTKRNMRSKAECATYCYADRLCRTAVYQHDGDCLFISNFTDTLTINEYNSPSSLYADEIIAVKSKTVMRTQSVMEVVECPQACTGYSVCFLDCTGDSTDPEPGCMDITTSQYDVEKCGFEPTIQSKEYYFPNLDRESSGNNYNFITVTFAKRFDWTTLRVKWSGTLRAGYGWGGGWGKWRILFNGGHCSNPGYIEMTHYNGESDTNHHKATGITAICYGLSASTHTITLNSEVSASTYFRAGYATYGSRFYVDELGQKTWSGEPAVAACPSMSTFNVRQHTFTTEWSNEPVTDLYSVTYTKMEASTILRITVNLHMRMHTGGTDTSSCAQYFIYIDNNHCSPHALGKALANLNYASHVNDEHRASEFEGHCHGIGTGAHTLKLQIASCPWGTGHYDSHTGGWHSNRNRIIVEEVRLGSNIMAVMSPDGVTMYKVPQFNVVTHGYGHLASGQDNGVVWNLPNYNKIYRTSGVRLTMSFDGRCYWGHANPGAYDECCRHYFLINGAECNNPGTIEGIHSLNKYTNLHRPAMIDGICEGIPAGTVTLSVYAGICKGFSQAGECYFGWNSYVHVMVSETYVDREIIS